MSHFLTSIHINKIFHLENIDIPIDDKEKKHLIITGKNGSGKTSVLLGLKEFLAFIIDDEGFSYLSIDSDIKNQNIILSELKKLPNAQLDIFKSEQTIDEFNKIRSTLFGKIKPTFSNVIEIFKSFKNGNFVLSYYEAKRKIELIIPSTPEKPLLKKEYGINENIRQEFIKFLIDLKVQEALARNENDESYANEIKEWFNSFNQLLKELFEGDNIELKFNFKDYSFNIEQDGRQFGFNQLSDGYSAIIDIVADLILKMQTPGSVTRAFQKEGIVLIDEIETHLHLELQKIILPFLTKVFPNIQFIVTTHSPFVLNSLDNAVAFDLEKKERLEDLSEYSYEALAEGYFNVTGESTYLDSKLKRFKHLLEENNKDSAIKKEIELINKELSELNPNLTPANVKAEYLQLKLKHELK